MKYIGVVRKEPKTLYGIDFPDVPGCISASPTQDAILENALEALTLHFEGVSRDAWPPARARDEIERLVKGEDDVVDLIEVEL